MKAIVWKQFLRPTVLKIIILVSISLLSIFVLLSNAEGYDASPSPPSFVRDYLWGPLAIVLLAPFFLLYGLAERTYWFQEIWIGAIALVLLYQYVLACVIYCFYRTLTKTRKQLTDTRTN